MPVSARLLDGILLNKLGFTRRDSHHVFYELRIQGQLARRTKISHSARDLSDKLLSAIARQIGVTRQQLLDIIACHIDRDGYLRLLGL